MTTRCNYIPCIKELNTKDRPRPDVDECKQFGVFDVRRILQSLEELVQDRHKLHALLTLSRRKEQHQDAVFEDPGDFALCVEFILVPVVLYQNSIQEQVHHDERKVVGKG